MSRKFRRRRAGVLVAAAALASLGGVDVMLVTSGSGPAPELAVAVAAQATPAAGQVPASPSQAVPPAVPSAPAAPAPAKIVEQPPPVVDGVRRTDVGSAHSPQLLQQLAAAPATMPAPAEAGALGVDVADYQHPGGAAIDWSQVAAAGYKFAFVKATEGDYYANPYYASDLAQAKAAGLYAAGYHFAVPNVSDGASQADYAVGTSGYTADGRTLPPALDIEYNPYGPECYGLSATQMAGWISAFTAEEQRLTGQRTVIYTTADWWDTCTGGSTAFSADPLWVAAYRDGSPPMPAGWGSWTFWQYTSRATIPGISGRVDVSYFLQAAVRLLDPGSQQNATGTAIQLQISSLNAAGGQSPQFAAAGLPPGLSISGSGLITGTLPPAAGTYQVTVTAASSSGATGSVSFLWTVTAGQPSPPLPASPPSVPSPPASASSPSPSPFLLPPSDSPAPAPSDPASAPPSDSASDSPAPADPAPSSGPASAAPSDPASPSDSPSVVPSPSDSASACAPAPAADSPSPSDSPAPSDSASACVSPAAPDSPSAAGSASPMVSAAASA
jgi:GH25 family lysozyme M1 (1,4-beta-N-acetylmuramidase)